MTRPIALFVAVLRLLSVVVAFQLSEVVHFADDVFELVTTGHHADDVTEDESDPDHDCPPGCPTCHHVHFSGASLPPADDVILVWTAMTEGRARTWDPAETAPSPPPLGSVYRPPRA